MRSLTFSEEPSYPLVFLVPQLRINEIRKEYIDAFGIPEHEVRVLELHLTGKKTSVGEMKRFVTEELINHLDEMVKYLVVADAGYYKVLTGEPKAEANLGYVRDCLYGPWKVVYVPNVQSIFYDPENVRRKIAQSMRALLDHVQGSYKDPGTDIIHFEAYPRTKEEIGAWLTRLLEMDCDLAIDIETFNLRPDRAGIGTISFAWNKHEGIAFAVDYVPVHGPRRKTGETLPYGKQVRNEEIRQLLKDFFRNFFRRAIYHNISYDVTVLVYQLFMTDILDTEGCLQGMETLLRNWDCTQLITYLATNSCARNKLSLKDQGQEFAGNYALTDIEDITKIPLDQLLRYNLVDALTTWYVEEKNRPKMIEDDQLDIYTSLFKPSVWDIVQMQLTGLPVDMQRTLEVEQILQKDCDEALAKIRQSKVVQEYTRRLNEKWVENYNKTRKNKRVTLADANEQFNPNSNAQLQDLLYNMLGLPVLDRTDNKQPATGAKTLKKLIHKTDDEDVKAFLEAMIDYGAVFKILTAFIPAMKDAVQGPDGWHYLIGSFQLGGTVSGRLSSRNPNLQNLPATGTKYAKLIKSCFRAPPGWLFCGLDFASLEDRISALTTKDPNKLKVYIDGYDAHCLRAYAYFGDQMPDIDPSSVESINSIKEKYPELRQKSKTPTFALTYAGSYITLMEQGFTEEEAKRIEARYHELYAVSDQWVQKHLDQAAKVGYITAAFGLRVRTPLLAQVVRGTCKTPYEAEAEARTAGNALGQSWCLLTNRASVEFMGKVRSGKHRLDIRPCAHIHDAQYVLVRDNVETVLYANEHMVKAIKWQEHPDIAHDQVHLEGTFSIFWPDWSNEIEIPNDADEETLFQTLRAKLEVVDESAA